MKVLSELSNDSNTKELKEDRDIDKSNLRAKKDLLVLKVRNDKLDIDKLKKVPSSLNKLKAKVDVKILISWKLFLII